MKFKLVFSPDGKKFIVSSSSQQSSSVTPSPSTSRTNHSDDDNSSDHEDSNSTMSKIAKYEEAEDDKHAVLPQPYLSPAVEARASNQSGDTKMTDAPEEAADHIKIRLELAEKCQAAAKTSEAITSPAAGKTCAQANGAGGEIAAREPTASPIPSKAAKVTGTKKLIPGLDATYAFYIDGVYEFWSMGLEKTQVVEFMKSLADKPVEVQRKLILKLMDDLKIRGSWRRLVRKDGKAARRSRDLAILSSACLTRMANIDVEYRKTFKVLDGKKTDDYPLAWVHLRLPSDKEKELWMVGMGFTVDDMH